MSGASGGRTLRFLKTTDVAALKSVTARKAGGLREMGIESVLDLLMHYPRRYIDRRNQAEIADLVDGEEALVAATVKRASTRRLRGRATMSHVVVADSSGQLTLVFFNQAWRARLLTPGTEVAVFGRAERYRGARQMSSPVVDLVGGQTGRLVPVYRQSAKAGIGSAELARFVEESLQRAGNLAEVVPEHWLAELDLAGRTAAFRDIHAPVEYEDKDRARRRLAFDELFRLQLVLVMRRDAAAKESRGVAHVVGQSGGTSSLVETFVEHLPFKLTGAQQRAVIEIAADLGGSHPMHRLLQGDVGSGKTVVALIALLYGIQGGHQGALMVPTEVLAEQHHISARTLLDGLSVPSGEHLGGKRPVEVALLTSRTPASERSRVHSELKSGRIDLLVGTHALLTETVEFSSLGVVVVDEQHRFGVEQRAALREKGPFIAPRDAPLLEVPQPVERSGDDSDAAPDAHLAGGAPERPVRPGPARAMPDVLVMTATPIPRTAAMTVYGDLDQTVLDELPEGRTPISTIWVDDPGGDGVAWDKVRAELDEGRQAYVICPLVGGGGPEDEEPEEVDLAPDLDGDSGEVGEEEVDGPDWFEEMARSVRAPEGHDLADKGPPRSVTDEVLRLQGEELAGYRLGVLHGQLPTREKEAVMAAFRRGDLQVLVATTVIEVGVDVGNATVMVIEDADRFGMAQLHQLRGRVGRGSLRSWCYLLASDVTAPAARRLEALAGTTDGFALAEVDLALRGEGTVLNIRQKGRSDLRLASLRHDRDLVVAARGVAEAIVGADPLLAAHPLLHDEVRLLVGEAGEEFLSKS